MAGSIYEMSMTVGGRKLTVFMQNGFFGAVENKVSHHSHSNTELHLMVRGQTEYMAGGNRLHLSRGQMVVIPGGMFHGGWDHAPDTFRLAFQINWPEEQLRIISVPESEADGLVEAIREYLETQDGTRMGLYIALICSRLGRIPESAPEPVRGGYRSPHRSR